jgi:ABC-type glycerol-3-phosphate transport system permease component
MAVSIEQPPVARASAAPGRPPSYHVGVAVRYGLLTLLAIIAFAPFILSFLGTFKTNAELAAFPPAILPKDWRIDNWTRVWSFTLPTVNGPVLPRWLFNSSWLAIVNVLLRLFFCSLAAYAFARMRFPGRNLIFSIVIASLALPAEITLIPGYIFYARINWINTYWPLIIPDMAVPIGIFMLTQFFKSIPRELEEAAYIDGASRFRTYWSIALPLSRPALLTLAILQFQGSWNDYTKPLLFLQKPNLMTLTVGMAYFRFQYVNDLSAILVGAMFNAIPMLILFFLFSKYYMQGASYSGLAGQ